MKYEISKENKDMIFNYLRQVVVPAAVGADLMSICQVLAGLKEIKPVPETPPVEEAPKTI